MCVCVLIAIYIQCAQFVVVVAFIQRSRGEPQEARKDDKMGERERERERERAFPSHLVISYKYVD